MPSLLVRTVNGENALRYADGDVVTVRPDGHVWGRMESLAVWLAEGRARADWPGGFAVVTIPDLPDNEARGLAEETKGAEGVMTRRRSRKLDYASLERREPGSGRDTLNTEGRITRSWADADVRAAIVAKG